MAKSKIKDYHGMIGPLTAKDKKAVDGLIVLLAAISRDTREIKLYGDMIQCVRKGKPRKTFNVWIIREIAFVTATGGASHMYDEMNLGLFKACEDYLAEFHTKAYRPQGWTTDIDEKADAEYRLRAVWKAGEGQTKNAILLLERDTREVWRHGVYLCPPGVSTRAGNLVALKILSAVMEADREEWSYDQVYEKLTAAGFRSLAVSEVWEHDA